MPAPYQALWACDLDGTLVGDGASLRLLNAAIAQQRGRVALAYVTGRSLHSTLNLIAEAGLVRPDFIASDVGTCLHAGRGWREDPSWRWRMSRRWSLSRVREAADGLRALRAQPAYAQGDFKRSYTLAPRHAPDVFATLNQTFEAQGLGARLIYSSQRDLDIVPAAGGKGRAVIFMASRLGLSLEQVFTAGDSGNDRDMLSLGCPAVAVANAEHALTDELAGVVYHAKAPYAAGVHEALRHFGLL